MAASVRLFIRRQALAIYVHCLFFGTRAAELSTFESVNNAC
jgi:hypothetical protein